MFQRIGYGALAILFVFGLLVVDARIAFDQRGDDFFARLLNRGSLVPVACAVLAGAAALELAALFRRAGMHPSTTWATVASVVIAVSPWLSAAGAFGFGPLGVEAVQLQFCLVAMAFLISGFMHIARSDVAAGLRDLPATWLVISYAGVLTSFLTLLRTDIAIPGPDGAWVILGFLAVSKASDIGAFFIGSAIGRHKLIPRISPAKSVEGVFGGIAASCAVALFFLYLHKTTALPENPLLPGTAAQQLALQTRTVAHDLSVLFRNFSVWQAVVFGVVMSVVGQLGDLIESLFKRSAGAKDSAHVLPSFGGILDMVDSPLAAAPVAWFLLTWLWKVA